MGKRSYTLQIVEQEQAEGGLSQTEPSASAVETQTVPAIAVRERYARFSSGAAPSAETGSVARVSTPLEGQDHSERQDAQRTLAETRAIAARQRETASGQKYTALIIEDTTELAEVVETTLRRMGMETVRESHGARAFERFAEILPDLILLDLGLPDITGWKVLDNIKELTRQAGTKMPVVIVITAMDDAANRVVGKLQGVQTYLVKPFTVTQLETAVRRALEAEHGSDR
ncbi:MAG: response regulator [Candidatus Flexifilum sp.]|jgi:CheY-like chemotaxis protein